MPSVVPSASPSESPSSAPSSHIRISFECTFWRTIWIRSGSPSEVGLRQVAISGAVRIAIRITIVGAIGFSF
jgi:hypothetical protein